MNSVSRSENYFIIMKTSRDQSGALTMVLNEQNIQQNTSLVRWEWRRLSPQSVSRFLSCNLSSPTWEESVFSLSARPAGVGGQHRPVEEGEQQVVRVKRQAGPWSALGWLLTSHSQLYFCKRTLINCYKYSARSAAEILAKTTRDQTGCSPGCSTGRLPGRLRSAAGWPSPQWRPSCLSLGRHHQLGHRERPGSRPGLQAQQPGLDKIFLLWDRRKKVSELFVDVLGVFCVPLPPSLPPQVHHNHQLSPFSPTLTSTPEGCSAAELKSWNAGGEEVVGVVGLLFTIIDI